MDIAVEEMEKGHMQSETGILFIVKFGIIKHGWLTPESLSGGCKKWDNERLDITMRPATAFKAVGFLFVCFFALGCFLNEKKG